MENFRVFGKIGEGAHGTVFHAEEIKTGQKVALKKLSLKRWGLRDFLCQGKYRLVII